MNSKHAFVEDLKARLDKLDTELSQLEVKAQQAKAEGRAAYEVKLSMLRQKRAEAKQKYTELHAAGENAWEHLKHGAEEAWASLRTALDKARSEFKS
jgi:chromosome segregation ATPase